MPQAMPTDQQWTDARALMGVADDVSPQDLHAAYLRLVRQHPPDRDPEQFEQIRNAYELLRNPRARAMQILGGPNPLGPLAELANQSKSQLRYVSMDLWMAALKEKRQ